MRRHGRLIGRRARLISSLVFTLLALPQLAFAQFLIQRVSSPIFYNDPGNNPSLTCAYAGYRVTNASLTSYPDVWVGIGSFAGGVVNLAPTDDGVLHLGPMAPGQSRMAYFYLQASATPTDPEADPNNPKVGKGPSCWTQPLPGAAGPGSIPHIQAKDYLSASPRTK